MRVFTYQVQPGRMAERLSYGRELVGLTRQQPGYRGLFVLIDPDTHASVSIQLWETEDDLHTSAGNADYAARLPHEPALSCSRDPGRIEAFAVAGHELAKPALTRLARVVTYTVQSGRIDELIAHLTERVRPVAGRLEGWTGYLLLADRSTNRIMAIGLWESAEHTEAAVRDPAFIASLPHEDYADGEVSLRYVDVDLVDEAAG